MTGSPADIPAVTGLETVAYTCEDTGTILGADSAEDCRKKHDDFPLIETAMSGTAYGGVHVAFNRLMLSFRLQSQLVFDNANAYAAPISGDLELAYRF